MSDVPHPVLLLPTPQCGVCGDVMRFVHTGPFGAIVKAPMIKLECLKCDIQVLIPTPVVLAEVFKR